MKVYVVLAILYLSILWDAKLCAQSLSPVESFDVDGIPVLLRQEKNVSIVSVGVFFKGGYSNAVNPTQVAQERAALSTLLYSGTSTKTKSFVHYQFRKHATTIQFLPQYDYYALILKSAHEEWDSSWDLFTDQLLHPEFDSVELEKNILSSELGTPLSSSDPERFIRRIADSIYFHNHPYGWSLLSSLRDLTLLDISLAYKEMLVKKRLLITVVGNVSRKEITEKLRNSLTTIPEGEFNARSLDDPIISEANTAYLIPFKSTLSTHYVLGYFKIPHRTSVEYLAWNWLSYYLSGNIRYAIEVTPAIAHFEGVLSYNARSPIGVISFETNEVKKSIELANTAISETIQRRFWPEELRHDAVRREVLYYDRLQSTENQAFYLGDAELTAHSWQDAFPTFIQLCDVSISDMEKVAKEYLRNINWFILSDTATIGTLGFEKK